MRTKSKYIRLINNLPILLLLIVPFVVLLPTIGSINYPEGGNYSDLAITHLPNAEFIKHSILVDHQIPLWNPLIMSGYPFAGDPLSGLWYPPGWLALLFPLPLGINLVTGLHIGIGAVGIFLLLRALAVRKEIALIFGICFALLPKIFAHFGAGHITYIYAVCLTPMLMWYETKREKTRSYLYLPTIIFSALIILADIRWYPFALVAWVCTAILTRDDSSNDEPNNFLKFTPFQKTGKQILKILADSIIGLFIAAPFILPFVEFLMRSTRISMVGGENLIYSLPPGRLLGLILPPEGGFSEWIIYAGLWMIFLMFISLLSKKRKLIFPTVVFIFSLLWSLGSNVSLIGSMESLPGLSLVRVPPRIIFLGEIMAIIAAAMTLEWICSQTDEKIMRRIALTVTGTVVFILLLGAGIWTMQHLVTNSILRLIILSPVYFVSLLLLLRYKKKIILFVIFGMVVLLDLYFADITLFSSHPPNERDSVTAVDIIKKDEGMFRVFSPTYSITQETAGKENIQLAEGVNPMQVDNYVQFLTIASGIPYTAYSVVIPPLIEKNNDNGIQNYDIGSPDSKALGLLNVRYLILNSLLSNSVDWKLVASSDRSWIYKNQGELPRAYMVGMDGIVQTSGVQLKNFTPNEIFLFTSNKAGSLVLSEISYPGWQAWVDGVKRPIKEYNGLFRSIELSEGQHQILFKYQPKTVYFGLLISGITLFVLSGIAVKQNAYR